MPAQPKPANLEKEMIKAAKHGATGTVLTLLAQDASLISARDTDGSTPLHCATWKGHERLVEVLLQQGAVPFRVDLVASVRAQHELERHPGIVAKAARAPDGPELSMVERLVFNRPVNPDLPRHSCFRPFVLVALLGRPVVAQPQGI